MTHVLIAGRIHKAGVELLQSASGVTLDIVDEVTREAYQPFLAKADAILIRTQPLGAAEVEAAPRLKIVSRHGVGYDAVDVKALDARGIPLCIVGDVNSRAVAEHTLMMMLAAARRTVMYDQAARSGDWNRRNTFEATELDEKMLLVFGYGRIGRRVAELSKAFGMRVLVHDPFVKEQGLVPAEKLDEALAAADYVTVHVPMSPKGAVLGTRELALLKPTAIVINTARGGLIDEIALDAALRDSKLAGAALDVLVDEPPKPNHALLHNERVTISPHNAGLTQECAKRMAVAAAQNILDFFAGSLEARLVVNEPR
jgi:D-3-phosphoglycerate dehydrogenase / 2-oxoglutarate reductase